MTASKNALTRAFLFLFLLCLLPYSTFAQWSSASTTTSRQIQSISMGSDLVGYATDFEVLMKTEDGGFSWSTLSIPQDANGLNVFSPRYVHFFNELEGIYTSYNVLSQRAHIFKTTDGGASWEMRYESGILQPIIFNKGIEELYFVSASTGYAVGSDGIIIKTTDGGSSWTSCASPVVDGHYYAVYFTTAQNGWVATAKQLFHTSNGGNSWRLLNPGFTINYISDLYFFDALHGNGIFDGTLYETHDGGSNWKKADTAHLLPGLKFKIIQFTDASAGYAMVDYPNHIYPYKGGPQLMKTTDGGRYWEPYQNFPNSGTVNGLQVRGNKVWLGAQYGKVIHTGNANAATLPLAFFEITSNVCIGTALSVTNKSRPGYAYEWWLNGEKKSTAFNPATFEVVAGEKLVLELKVIKQELVNNFIVEQTVYEAPDAPKKPAILTTYPSKICAGSDLRLDVENLDSYTTYEVFDDQGVAVGEPQTTGSYAWRLFFNVKVKDYDTRYTIKARRENVCGSAESTGEFLAVVHPTDIAFAAYLETDTLCRGQNTRIVIPKTLERVSYRYKNTIVEGTGDTIFFDLSVSANSGTGTWHEQISTSTICGTRYFSVGPITVSNLFFQQGRMIYTVGESASFQIESNINKVRWDFGEGASPRYASNSNIAHTTFLEPGPKQIVVRGLSETCTMSDTLEIMVYPAAQLPQEPTVCSTNEAHGAPITLLDSHLDKFGNLYTAGYKPFHNGSGSVFYITKKSVDGIEIYSKQAGSFLSDESAANKLLTDDEGNVYIGGTAYGNTLYFDNRHIFWTVSADMNLTKQRSFIIKLDSEGNYLWHIFAAVKNDGVANEFAVLTDMIFDNTGNLLINFSQTGGGVYINNSKKQALYKPLPLKYTLFKVSAANGAFELLDNYGPRCEQILHYDVAGYGHLSTIRALGNSPRLMLDKEGKLLVLGTTWARMWSESQLTFGGIQDELAPAENLSFLAVYDFKTGWTSFHKLFSAFTYQETYSGDGWPWLHNLHQVTYDSATNSITVAQAYNLIQSYSYYNNFRKVPVKIAGQKEIETAHHGGIMASFTQQGQLRWNAEWHSFDVKALQTGRNGEVWLTGMSQEGMFSNSGGITSADGLSYGLALQSNPASDRGITGFYESDGKLSRLSLSDNVSVALQRTGCGKIWGLGVSAWEYASETGCSTDPKCDWAQQAQLVETTQKTLNEDEPLAFDQTWLSGIILPQGAAAAFTLKTIPNHGTITLAGEIPADGQALSLDDFQMLIYTPGEHWSGLDSLSYEAVIADKKYRKKIRLQVLEVNDLPAPFALVPMPEKISRDTVEQLIFRWYSAYDPDDNVLLYTLLLESPRQTYSYTTSDTLYKLAQEALPEDALYRWEVTVQDKEGSTPSQTDGWFQLGRAEALGLNDPGAVAALYPNPFNDFLRITMARPGRYEVQVISLQGQKLIYTTFEGMEWSWDGRLNGQPLPPGAYLLRLQNHKGELLRTRMLIKQ